MHCYCLFTFASARLSCFNSMITSDCHQNVLHHILETFAFQLIAYCYCEAELSTRLDSVFVAVLPAVNFNAALSGCSS